MTVYVLMFLIAGQVVGGDYGPAIFADKAACEKAGQGIMDEAVSERISKADTLTFHCIEAPLIGWQPK